MVGELKGGTRFETISPETDNRGMIKDLIDNDVKFINPLKLREYLSAGLPVRAANRTAKPVANVARVSRNPAVGFSFGKKSPLMIAARLPKM